MTNAERWALVQRVIPWIETLLTRHRVRSGEREDVRSFVYIYMADRAHEYDPSLGTPCTWSRWIVRGAVNDYRRLARQFGPKSLHRERRLRVPLRTRVWHDEHDEDAAIAEIDARHLPSRIAIEMTRLPAREATAIVQTMAGMKLREVGATLGVTHEAVRQMRERGLQRVRASMGI